MIIRKFTAALHFKYVPYDQFFGKRKTDKPEIAMMTQSATAECPAGEGSYRFYLDPG